MNLKANLNVCPRITFPLIHLPSKVRRLYELFHVVQDMLVPLSALSESVDVMERDFDVYPVSNVTCTTVCLLA